MSIVPVAGATYDLYREQLFNNPSVYDSANTSDDYRFNITPATPARPNLTAVDPYGTQPIQAGWHNKNKGDVPTAAWTSSFPVIPGQ